MKKIISGFIGDYSSREIKRIMPIVEKIKDNFKTWEAKEASINTTEPKFNPCIIKKNKDI